MEAHIRTGLRIPVCGRPRWRPTRGCLLLACAGAALAGACSDDVTGPDAAAQRLVPGVYFVATQNDSTIPIALPAPEGCTVVNAGGYLVLSRDRTFHGSLGVLEAWCASYGYGEGLRHPEFGAFEVREGGIAFHSNNSGLDYQGLPADRSASPDLDVTWSGLRLHLQREPDAAEAARRILELDRPTPPWADQAGAT